MASTFNHAINPWQICDLALFLNVNFIECLGGAAFTDDITLIYPNDMNPNNKIKEIHRKILENPTNTNLWVEIGAEYLTIGDNKNAEEAFGFAVTCNPMLNLEHLVNRGVDILGKYNVSREQAVMAAKIRDEAMSSLKQEPQFKSFAISKLEESLKHNPNDPLALAMKLEIASSLGNSAEELSAMRRYAGLFNFHPLLQHHLALLEQGFGNTHNSLKAHLNTLNLAPKNIVAYLYAAYALLMAKRDGEALQVYSLGCDRDESLRNFANDKRRSQNEQGMSRELELLYRKFLSQLHRKTTSNEKRVADAVWVQTHDRPFSFKNSNQKPHLFYIPSLKPVTFVDDIDMPWVKDLEKVASDIQEEFLNAQSVIVGKGHPYIGPDMVLGSMFAPLVNSLNWEAVDLFREAKVNEEIAPYFPKTIAALLKTPIAKHGENPIEAFFSLLKPNQHIPPHFGVANNRMTVHLPIIVPESCRIRCADEWRQWQEGKVLAFDDSFDHEAINGSDSLRVVLIFETWHPDMTVKEIEAVNKSFEYRNNWLMTRKIPLE